MDSASLSNTRQMSMPHGFLSLAPETSGGLKGVADGLAMPRRPTRRSSSLSSESSNKSGYKVLKLSPVHLGEHADDHKGDWHNVAVGLVAIE